MYKLCIFIILLLCHGCKQAEKTIENIVDIDYQGASKIPLSNIPDSIWGNPEYVLIKDPLLELPEKCIYPDNVKNHLLHEGQVIVLHPLQSF